MITYSSTNRPRNVTTMTVLMRLFCSYLWMVSIEWTMMPSSFSSIVVQAQAQATSTTTTPIERMTPIPNVQVDCDPCIARNAVSVRAIYHGVKEDPFWQQMKAAVFQAAKDLGVSVEVTLYDVFDPSAMVADLEAILAASSADRPDALIVTIPTDDVKQVVERILQETDIAVFGCNSGYKVAKEAGVLAFVGQDEYMAGVEAAQEVLRATGGTLRNALFINHEKGNSGFQDRFDGFSATILAATGVEVEEMIIDGVVDDQALVEDIRPVFTGCPNHVVVLLGVRPVTVALEAFDGLFADCTGRTFLATFDMSRVVYAGISQRKIAVGISQQPYLQAVLPVLFAVTFVTTKQLPNLSSDGEFGILLSGPSIVKQENVPTDTFQICSDDAFPVCPNTLKVDESGTSECPCVERKNIRIGGVLHGMIGDSFWDETFAAAMTAANDLNVALRLNRMEEMESQDEVYLAMAKELDSLCSDDYDGVFISIPEYLDESHPYITAIEDCLALRIPTISIHSGPSTMIDNKFLIHIGQVEERAGYAAGEQLLEFGATKGWCVTQDVNSTMAMDRCRGLEQALVAGGAEYLGIIDVSDEESYVETIETAVIPNQGNDNWKGMGLMLMSPTLLDWTKAVSDGHAAVILGVFGNTKEVRTELDDKSLAFAIDQQQYLQGYLAVALLTYHDYTKQKLVIDIVETGPRIISSSSPLSEEETVCYDSLYPICQRTNDPESPLDAALANLRRSKTISLPVFLIIILVIVGVFVVAVIVVAFLRCRRKKQEENVTSERNDASRLRHSSSAFSASEQPTSSRAFESEKRPPKRVSGQLSGRRGSSAAFNAALPKAFSDNS